MTTRCTQIARAAALLVLTLMLFGASSVLRAQDARCLCDHYTIAVDAAVACKITVCYQLSPSGPTFCTVIEPGTRGKIPCPVYEASITTCSGSHVIIDNNPAIAICTPSLAIARGCCVRACRGIDADGCSLFTVSAAPCLTPNCP